jgi:hypothetical protein
MGRDEQRLRDIKNSRSGNERCTPFQGLFNDFFVV